MLEWISNYQLKGGMILFMIVPSLVWRFQDYILFVYKSKTGRRKKMELHTKTRLFIKLAGSMTLLFFFLLLVPNSTTAQSKYARHDLSKSASYLKSRIFLEVNKVRIGVCYREDIALEKLKEDYNNGIVRYIPDPKNLHLTKQFKTFEEILEDKGGDCEDLAIYNLSRLVEMGVPKYKLGLQIWWKMDGDVAIGHVEPLVWIRDTVWAIKTNGQKIDAEPDLERRKDSLLGHAIVHFDTGKTILNFGKDEITVDVYSE